MFEEKPDLNWLVTNFLDLAKKLSISVLIYLITLVIACFCIIFALLKLISISDSAVAAVCVDTARESNSVSNIYVDMAGAVKNPGIYSLQYTQRLAQAIEKAGGLSKSADKIFVSKTLNLAKMIEDGEKIYIPFEGELENFKDSPELNPFSLVSINAASLEELDSLPGIGEKRAEDIFTNRPYSQLKDLLEKDVLSEGTFDSIEEFIEL